MLRRQLTFAAYLLAATAIAAAPAAGKTTKSDQAPPPPAVPVGAVGQTPLDPPWPQNLDGPARAISGDRISLVDYQVRLYGIAAPEMAADRGPPARVALDSLLDGRRVKCTIFGKTTQGDLVGQCRAGEDDLAAAQLSKGMAAVYRDSNPNEAMQQALTQYDAAENAARQQNLGIWSKPPAAPAPMARTAQPEPIFTPAALAYILTLIAVLTIPITMVSIWRSNSGQRERRRQTRRYALATGLAAEAEIIRAAARQIRAQIANLPQERPLPYALGPVLTLPSASFWSANAKRLELLPVEVMVPLLRLYALHEETARKLAPTTTVPTSAIAFALSAVETASDRAIDTIENAMGIKRAKPAEAPITPSAPPPATEATPPAAVTPAAEVASASTAQTADSAPLPR